MSPSGGSAALRAAEAVPVFAALGDATRLSLVGRLSVEGPLSITRLSEGTGVTRQAITRHLHALGDAGLVRNARRGREQVFELDVKRLEIARRYLDEISAQWDSAADRLKAFVEDDSQTPEGA
jgi:DNA-binding transcriptional ArsR family regulator